MEYSDPRLLAFLQEDMPAGDITSDLLIPDIACTARIRAKEDGIVAGTGEAAQIFSLCHVETGISVTEGSPVGTGDVVMNLEGPARGVLAGERTALNLLSRMSGIATLTRSFCDIVSTVSPACRIAATRKTCPGIRSLDKKAVAAGGGDPHRLTLSDGILIKDNHLVLVPLVEAIERARRGSLYRRIEVEVETTEDALLAARAGAEILLLDNMDIEMTEKTVRALCDAGLREGILLESSGGITLGNAAAYARTGVDILSVGALTHSPPALDFSLEILS